MTEINKQNNSWVSLQTGRGNIMDPDLVGSVTFFSLVRSVEYIPHTRLFMTFIFIVLVIELYPV